jgi:hypothetical protein
MYPIQQLPDIEEIMRVLEAWETARI